MMSEEEMDVGSTSIVQFSPPVPALVCPGLAWLLHVNSGSANTWHFPHCCSARALQTTPAPSSGTRGGAVRKISIPWITLYRLTRITREKTNQGKLIKNQNLLKMAVVVDIDNKKLFVLGPNYVISEM